MAHVVYDPEDDPLNGRPVSVFTRGVWQDGITLFAETGLAIVNGVEEAGPSDTRSLPSFPHPYTLAASVSLHSLAWPLVALSAQPNCLPVVHRCARTNSPHLLLGLADN